MAKDKKPKQVKDINQLAKSIVDHATGGNTGKAGQDKNKSAKK